MSAPYSSCQCFIVFSVEAEQLICSLVSPLHWLLISQHITFNIVLMMLDCSCGQCAKYFGDVYIPVHTIAACSRLRSADHGDIVVPWAWSTQFGCCSLCVWEPTIWNKLRQDLLSTDTREQFKCRFKGWLFKCAYGRKRVWWTLTEGVPYKWIDLLTSGNHRLW